MNASFVLVTSYAVYFLFMRNVNSSNWAIWAFCTVIKRCLDGRGLFSLCVCSFLYCTTLSPPPHPVHIICPCTWEVIDIRDVTRTTRNADGMGWSQPELGEKKTLASQRRGKAGRYGCEEAIISNKNKSLYSFPLSLTVHYPDVSLKHYHRNAHVTAHMTKLGTGETGSGVLSHLI